MNAFFCLDCRREIELTRHGRCEYCDGNGIAPPHTTGSDHRRAGAWQPAIVAHHSRWCQERWASLSSTSERQRAISVEGKRVMVRPTSLRTGVCKCEEVEISEDDIQKIYAGSDIPEGVGLAAMCQIITD